MLAWTQRHGSPVRDVRKEVIGVAFALPEVGSVFFSLFAAFRIEVLQEFQDDDLADFEFEAFARQVYFVAWYERKEALSVFGQLRVDVNPVQEFA